MTTTTGGDLIRLLIVDDQTLFRSGLARLLNDDPKIDVIAEAVDGADAVKKAIAMKPDVILMDIRMPNLDGIEATSQILAANPAARVLILSTVHSDSNVVQALKAGASGYVLKDSRPEAIVSSILAVMSGERVMASSIASKVLDMITGTTTSKRYLDGLTGRELEILQLISAGSANKHIAYVLNITEKTVRNHVSNMYEKLGIYDRSQAVLYALRKGLIEV